MFERIDMNYSGNSLDEWQKQFSNKFNCENTENYPNEILPERINNYYSVNLSNKWDK